MKISPEPSAARRRSHESKMSNKYNRYPPRARNGHTKTVQGARIPALHEHLLSDILDAMPADSDEDLEPEQDRPPAEEVVQRIARRSRVDLGRSVAEIVREERERRTVPKNDPGASG